MGRLTRFLLWIERRGWKANLVLLLATIASTTFTGGLLFGARAGWTYSLAALLILGSHEMGHYLACRAYGVSATLPFFLPMPFVLTGTFGAVIRIRDPIRDRNALFDIGIAGPLAGFVVLVPVLLLGLAGVTGGGTAADPAALGDIVLAAPPLAALLASNTPGPAGMLANPLLLAAWFGMLATAMNLLPAGQLDGGHVCFAISRRVHRTASRLTVGLLGAASLYSWLRFGIPFWIVWLLVVALIGPRHPPLIDEETPLSPGRRLVALIGLAVFLLCFTPAPVQ